MLEIEIPQQEKYDYKTGTFYMIEKTTLRLEHSLVSISKWEAETHKPFLDYEAERTPEENLLYIKCMCMTQNVPDEVFEALTEADILRIRMYIEDPMTATILPKNEEKHLNRMVYTSEVLYAKMVQINIPFECQKWHINRLLTLMGAYGELEKEAQGGNKMSQSSLASKYAEMKAKQRAKAKKP